MYVTLKIVIDSIRVQNKNILSLNGHRYLFLFSLLVSTACLYLEFAGNPLSALPIYIITYLLFMFSFIAAYILYRLITESGIVDVDFFWIIPLGSVLYYII